MFLRVSLSDRLLCILPVIWDDNRVELRKNYKKYKSSILLLFFESNKPKIMWLQKVLKWNITNILLFAPRRRESWIEKESIKHSFPVSTYRFLSGWLKCRNTYNKPNGWYSTKGCFVAWLRCELGLWWMLFAKIEKKNEILKFFLPIVVSMEGFLGMKA